DVEIVDDLAAMRQQVALIEDHTAARSGYDKPVGAPVAEGDAPAACEILHHRGFERRQALVEHIIEGRDGERAAVGGGKPHAVAVRWRLDRGELVGRIIDRSAEALVLIS